MERKILFKAKRLDNSEWVKGYYAKNTNHKYIGMGDIVEDGEEHLIFGMTKTDIQPYWYEVDPSTVCQFTGLKDNYGVDIWEHDIITISKGREPCEVIFEKGCFKVVSSKGIHTAIEKGLDYYCWDLRVIDNKFDRKDGE